MANYKIGRLIKVLTSSSQFEQMAFDAIKKSATGGNRKPDGFMLSVGNKFAEMFQTKLSEKMGEYSDYSHVEHDVEIGDDGRPIVYLRVDIPENYSPSLYLAKYKKGILMTRMLDTGFDDVGQHLVFGTWIKHGIFTYGLRERKALNFIQETIDEIYAEYGVEVEVDADFYKY